MLGLMNDYAIDREDSAVVQPVNAIVVEVAQQLLVQQRLADAESRAGRWATGRCRALGCA